MKECTFRPELITNSTAVINNFHLTTTPQGIDNGNTGFNGSTTNNQNSQLKLNILNKSSSGN
jgi:hypothetical protein